MFDPISNRYPISKSIAALISLITLVCIEQALVAFRLYGGSGGVEALLFLLVASVGIVRLLSAPPAFFKVPFYRAWFGSYCVWTTWMILVSWIEGLVPIRDIIYNAIPWLLVVLIVVGHQRGDWYWLNKMFVCYAIGGSLLTLFALKAFNNNIAVIDRMVFITQTPLMGAASILGSVVPFLLFTFAYQGLVGKMASIVGLLLWSTALLVGQFRHGMLIIALICVLAIFFHHRSGMLRKPNIKAILAFFVILLCSVFFFYSQVGFLSDLLDRSVDALLLRLDNLKGDKAYGFSERLDEASCAARELAPWEWLTGRGVSGVWSGQGLGGINFGEERGMLHFGPMHYILKGGYPLLFLYVLLPFGTALKRTAQSRDPITLACSGVVILWLVGFFIANWPHANLNLVVRMLSVGVVAAAVFEPKISQCNEAKIV